MINQSNSDNGSNILSAWVALEVLAPQTYQKPESLAGGNVRLISFLDDKIDKMPWDSPKKPLKPGNQIFYQVVIGTISFKHAILLLIEKYKDGNLEHPSSASETVVASVTVDQNGIVTNGDSIVISSFGWAIHQVLNDKLKHIKNWASVEATVRADLSNILRKTDEHGKELPLNISTINEAYNYLKDTLKIPLDIISNKKFTVKVFFELRKRMDPPQPLLLNSFFLKDLARSVHLITSGNAPANLLKYLGLRKPEQRLYVFKDCSILEDALSPVNIPPARWPGAGRHPLVLLQQAAINLSTKLNNDGILAINGPPGTGKTTLLRDIIANLVAKRAEMLVKFDDPLKAFVDSERRVKLEQGSRTIYNLDKSIKGFEILIVSSNNKAVENISVELPNIKAIACDADDLRYFNTLSDQLIGHETWGLISAVLGNNTNRSNFQKKFWSDNDFGLFTYLKEAAGSPQIFNIKDQDGKIIGSRKPKIIENHNPPLNHIEALKRWQCAREDFLAKLSLSQDKLAKLQEIKEVVQHLSSLKSNFKSHNFEETLVEHKKFKPNFISRILKTISACDWQKQFEELLHCIDVKNKVDIFSADLDSHFIDSNLFLKAHKEIHLVSPWCDAETQRLRDEVFISAIKLHKAFIDAAAKPLLDNIGILMRNLCRQVDFLNIEVSYTNIGSTDILSSLPDLWSSLFLIVPSVSSAFASIESMIGYLPKESLGWLLIDEAGQALPQAAVGAIMRARNIIITGDPLQIAPVVTLPDTLTKSICREFEVDPNLYNAPFASVQTLADSASKYFSEFHTNYGNRTVGFPLLVHRRCAEPMFSISNAIAYENLMVQAKSFVDSPIRNCLGPSNWFNIKGKPIDKWCPEEGEFVLALLRKLRAEEVYPDLYIIAPFKIIVNNLRSMIKRSNIMDSWPGVPTDWTKERIGTTHTVQGREAEAVIFVLGATARDQHGSRTWAGYSPNLVNVAVTRAKEATYIVGNRDLWKEAGVFRELYNRINTN